MYRTPGQGPDTGKLDVGACLNESWRFYLKNFLILVLAAVIADIISRVTAGILWGPMIGGYYFMLLRAMDRDDSRVVLGDLFGIFSKFWSLFALLIIELILVYLGFACLIVPGVILSIVWLYSQLFVVDQGQGAIESLRNSWRLVVERGFGQNALVFLIAFALIYIPMSIPYLGILLLWVTYPLAMLVPANAYDQMVRKVPQGAQPAGGMPPELIEAISRKLKRIIFVFVGLALLVVIGIGILTVFM